MPNRECPPFQDKPSSCTVRHATYKIICKLCQEQGTKSVYFGETHRTWGDRQREHQKALTTNNPTYATVNHQNEDHQGQEPSFIFKLDRGHRSTIGRQISEALLIQTEPRDKILNTKSEWGFNFLPQQITTTRDENTDTSVPSRDNSKQIGQDPSKVQLKVQMGNEANQSASPSKPIQRPEPSLEEQFNDQFQQRKKRTRLMKSETNLGFEHHTLPECKDRSSNPGAIPTNSGPKSAKKPPSRGSPSKSKHTQSAKAKVQTDEQSTNPKQVTKSLSTANLRQYFKALKHMSLGEKSPTCFSNMQNSVPTKRKSSD